MQAVGYRRWMIALNMIQESLIATMLGVLLALTCGLLLADGLALNFASGVFTLNFDNWVLMLGLLSGLVLGIVGCVPPLWRCLAPSLAATMRGLA